MPHQNIAKLTCYEYIKIVPKEMILIHWEIPLRFMSTIFWNYKYLYFQPILVSSLSFTLSSEHTRRIWGALYWLRHQLWEVLINDYELNSTSRVSRNLDIFWQGRVKIFQKILLFPLSVLLLKNIRNTNVWSKLQISFNNSFFKSPLKFEYRWFFWRMEENHSPIPYQFSTAT